MWETGTRSPAQYRGVRTCPIGIPDRVVVTRIIVQQPPSHRPYYDCRDVECTWPCAHHHYRGEDMEFLWYPDLEKLNQEYPEIPRDESKMKVGLKTCQFCRIFFGIIERSGCGCGLNAQNDHMQTSGGCACKSAICRFRSNGQFSYVDLRWTCYGATYELGLATGKAVWTSGHSTTFLMNLFWPVGRRRPRSPIHTAMHGRLTWRSGI